MRTWVAFLGGLLVGGLLVGVGLQTATAQSQNRGLVGLNHIGVTAPDMEKAIDYYTRVLGFRVAFRSDDDAGKPRLVYLQISKNTFLELNRADGDRPPGINHLGIHVENAADAVAMFRARGAEVEDPRKGSTGSIIANLTAIDGVRIELNELPADSAPRKAMESWH
jgi:catechol 2,3-dioxygenase-like lactoylglutathione lyase family enzyme